jgi:hypothetical protein
MAWNLAAGDSTVVVRLPGSVATIDAVKPPLCAES